MPKNFHPNQNIFWRISQSRVTASWQFLDFRVCHPYEEKKRIKVRPIHFPSPCLLHLKPFPTVCLPSRVVFLFIAFQCLIVLLMEVIKVNSNDDFLLVEVISAELNENGTVTTAVDVNGLQSHHRRTRRSSKEIGLASFKPSLSHKVVTSERQESRSYLKGIHQEIMKCSSTCLNACYPSRFPHIITTAVLP